MTERDLSRFLAKVSKDADGCWRWTAYRDEGGYGIFHAGAKQTKRSHRISYEHFVGPIPSDREIDHLCRNRSCVNPAHLEPVTRRENVIRGIAPELARARGKARHTCPSGHRFTKENTYWQHGVRIGRRCRQCEKLRQRALRAATGYTRKHRFITHDGVTLTLNEWARRIGMRQSTLSRRVNALGWDPVRALTEPIEQHQRAGSIT